MLRTLRIRDLATIDDLHVEFGPGLNVLTGETGAGKSIVVDALGLAAGDRADATLIRAGAERAVVEASFEPPFPDAVARIVAARGIDPPDDGIVVRRELVAGAGGRVFVNGSPVTVAVLREIGDALVELHGQHEHQSLFSTERHLELLDAFGGHRKELESVEERFRELERAVRATDEIRARDRERAARGEALRAVIREIDAVAPKPGESEGLERERRIVHGAERVAGLLDDAVAMLYEGEPSAAALAAGAARRAAELATIDPGLTDFASRIDAARLELQDVGASLRDYREMTDFDPGRLETIEARRAALARLLLRYGPDERAAIAARDEAAAELSALDGVEAAAAAAGTRLAEALEAYGAAARSLSTARRAAAARLGPAVEAQLRELALGKAKFEVLLSPSRSILALEGAASPGPIGPRGSERAEFRLAANPGEDPRALAKVASGGELSRTMLALQVVLDAGAPTGTLVFDEVDAGVGGAVAAAVGARLARLGARHQVLCVTHLPQVAAHARRHYHVRKRLAEGRASTEVAELDEKARLDELARMLGGRKTSEAARRNAAALLAEAAAALGQRARGQKGA